MGHTTKRELVKILAVPSSITPRKYTYYDVRVDPDFLAIREEDETEFEHIVRACEAFKGKDNEEILKSLYD